MKSIRPRSKAAQPVGAAAPPSVSAGAASGRSVAVPPPAATVTTSHLTGGARPKIPRANPSTPHPVGIAYRTTVDRPGASRPDSAIIKPSGTSVKRKLSTSTRLKPGTPFGTVTPKRERPDPEARSVSREPKIPVKSRKIWGCAMPRAASKDSVSSSGSRENVPPGGGPAVGQLQKEKHVLERRVSELSRSADAKQAEVATLRSEIGKLREQNRAKSETVLLEVESLHAENKLLKDRLEELGAALSQGAPLSDSEKEFLLQKKCNSAPPSISGASNIMSYLASKNELDADDYCGMERALSDRGSLEWDKQSSSSVSEMSVACLQDRIMQMEETHYSTSEELQATLQELSDLQDQLMEVQNENERLADEKAALLESLYGKVRQLEESRLQADALKQLLLRRHEDDQCREDRETAEEEALAGAEDDSGSGAAEALTPVELEHRLLELLKIGEEERRALLLKQEELARAGEEQRADVDRQVEQLSDRNRVLECSLESVNADKRLLERQLAEVREAASGERIELGHLRSVLENERAKVLELQQARLAQNKSELDKLLDAARKEKDRLEVKSTSLQEQLALSQCEAERLREQLSVLQEEAMVSKNNAKKHASDLEYRLSQTTEARDALHRQTLDLRESVHELERKCQRHLEDKRELRATISELQKTLNEASGRAETTQRQLDEARDKHRVDSDEWQQFQQDLLMTVRVANDFKTEAQQEAENLALETRQLRERITSLEAENERLKTMKTTTSSPPFQRKPLQSVVAPYSLPECVLAGAVAVSDAQEVVAGVMLRTNSRADSRLSVKSLIATLEGAATKPGATSVTGELVSPTAKVSPLSPPGGGPRNIVDKPLLTPILRRRDNEIYIKPPSRPASSGDASVLRDQKNPANATNIQPLRPLQRNSYADDILAGNNNRAATQGVGLGGQNGGVSGGGGGNLGGNNGGGGGGKQASGTPDKGSSAPIGKDGGDPYRSPASSVGSPTPVSILANKLEGMKRSSFGDGSDKKDPLATLAKGGGSKRNALLKWCQNKTIGYKGIDITNFSSSWNDGMAFCAILHTYLPDLIPYDSLENKDKRRNFTVAFQAAEAVGIKTILNTGDMISMERPDWQSIMSYVTSIYRHFET